MSNLPAHFIADVRHPTRYLDLHAGQWFQWRSVHLIELSTLDTSQFVQSMLPHPAQTIVEVGCGNSYLSFGLARDGHEVIGIDVSPDSIKVAERSSAAHPHPPGFGSLRYLCTDVNTWQAAEARFDCVIFNRALQHLSALQQTMAKMKCLLMCGDRIICQDTPLIVSRADGVLALSDATPALLERAL